MILRILLFSVLVLIALYLLAFTIALGVVSALKLFWKKDMDNGNVLSLIIASGVVVGMRHREKEKEDGK